MQMTGFGPTTGAGSMRRGTEAAPAWQPAIDIIERAGSYELLADLPGIDPEAISIEVRDNVLSLSGQREASPGDGRPQRRERASGAFRRQVTLPGTIDVDAIDARAAHGTLTITIPKRPQARQRRIAVNEATGAQ